MRRSPADLVLGVTRHTNAEKFPSIPRWDYLRQVIAAVEILAKLGRLNQSAATTMAAVLVLVVLMAYWILKT